MVLHFAKTSWWYGLINRREQDPFVTFCGVLLGTSFPESKPTTNYAPIMQF